MNQQLPKDVVTLTQEFSSVDKATKTLEEGFQLMEVDFTDFNREFDNAQSSIENLDNLSRKNNLRLCRLHKFVEGQDLKAFIEHMLSDLDGPNATTQVSVQTTYRVGFLHKTRKTLRW